MGFLTACLILPISVIVFCMTSPMAKMSKGRGPGAALNVILAVVSFVMMAWSALRIFLGLMGFVFSILSTVLAVGVVIVLAVMVWHWLRTVL